MSAASRARESPRLRESLSPHKRHEDAGPSERLALSAGHPAPHISPRLTLILLKVVEVLCVEDICRSMAGSETLIICR